jgi:hypothetical protein
MATTNLLSLKTVTKSRRPRRSTRPAGLKRQAPAAGLGLVLAVLLGLPVSHLARGITMLTGADLVRRHGGRARSPDRQP